MLSKDPLELATWLTSLARGGLREFAWILDRPIDAARAQALFTSFADESGDRRPIDALLLSIVTEIPLTDEAKARILRHAHADPALALWIATAAGSKEPAIRISADGPLFVALRESGIETWTEAELSGLHAMSLQRDLHAARMDTLADWLVAEMQPDNGTNRPWAVHVFLRRWITRGDVESRLYAESLIHNCRVTLGVPDRLSAVILASGAKWLREWSGKENGTG